MEDYAFPEPQQGRTIGNFYEHSHGIVIVSFWFNAVRPYFQLDPTSVSVMSRASIGGGRGGDASPHFSGWGDSIGIVPPTFQLRKIATHIA